MTSPSAEREGPPAPSLAVSRWPAAFQDPTVEERYRETFLSADRLLFLLPIFLTNVSNGVFLLSDLDFTGGGAAFQQLFLIRLGLLVTSLVVLVVLWRAQSVSVVDGTLFLWLLYACGLTLSLVGTRPLDYAPRVLMDGFFILVIFFMVPIRFTLQCIPVWILSLGTLWQILFVMDLDPASFRSVMVVLIFGNVFGAWTAWQWHLDRRGRFAQLIEERRLRKALEQQRERGRILEGLLPICSTCKSIRDDEGYWQKLEQYLSERTNALLTHGICPDCEQAVYSDLDTPRP